VQTAIAVVVIALFAATGQDPVLALFSWLTTVGTLGIIVLMALTSASVVAFFARNPSLEPNALKSKVLPTLAGLALLFIIFQIVTNFGNLSGASGVLGWLLPSLVLIAAVVGYLLAVALKGRDAAAFARLGSQQF
jgi:hypothetical protein